MRDGGRVGLESQGGAIRADSSGVRVWRWVGDRGGTEVGRASTHGSGGGSERGSGATQEDGTSGVEDGTGGDVDLVDSEVGPQGSPEAASYGAADLRPDSRRGSGMHASGADGSAVCGAAQACPWFGRTRGVRSAELRLGRRGAGRLVRSVCRSWWRTGQATGVLDAFDGQRCGLSSSV